MKAAHFSPDTWAFIQLLDRYGVSFEKAWRSRETLVADDGSPVHLISLALLIANKEASARPKDLDDVAFLRAAARRAGL